MAKTQLKNLPHRSSNDGRIFVDHLIDPECRDLDLVRHHKKLVEDAERIAKEAFKAYSNN